MKEVILQKLKYLMRTGRPMSELYPHEFDIILLESAKSDVRDEIRDILNDMHFLETRSKNASIHFEGPILRFVTRQHG